MYVFKWNVIPTLLILQSPLLKYLIFRVSQLPRYCPEGLWGRSLKLHPYCTMNVGLYFPALYTYSFWCSDVCVCVCVCLCVTFMPMIPSSLWVKHPPDKSGPDIKTCNGINWRQIDRRGMATPFEPLTESIMYLTPRKFAIKAVEAVRGREGIFSKGR
jgi:hypothetical protein